MNTGIISSRYAKALLLYLGDAPDTQAVYDQAQTLEKALGALPQFGQALSSPADIDDAAKMDLLREAVGEKMDPRLERFLSMVLTKGRSSYLQLILHAFREQYLKEKHILVARLVTAVPAPALQEKLSAILREKTGCDIRFEAEVDLDLIGGFVLEVDGFRVDAAVSSQLEELRKQFVRKNKRIV